MKDNITRMAEIFKALGDPTRLRIFRMLAAHPDKKLCVGYLAQRLVISQPAASQHLKVLKNVGLAEPNREGFRVHYAINPEALAAFQKDWETLSALIQEDPCPGEETCVEKGK